MWRDGAEWEKLAGVCEKWCLPGCWSEGEAALANQLMAASSPSVCCSSEKGKGKGVTVGSRGERSGQECG